MNFLKELFKVFLNDNCKSIQYINKIIKRNFNFEFSNNRLSVEHLHRLYLFSLVWGIGAFLENRDRKKYDEFLRTKFKSFDFPAPYDINVSVFDFYVNIEGKN